MYPVLSRRSGGLSIGINLNTNNACNWACVYCQVPQLSRGSAPAADLSILRQELELLLDLYLSGKLAQQYQLSGKEALLRDIAISGNGEPTSCPNFSEVVTLIDEITQTTELTGKTKLILITNGSLVHRSTVRDGLAVWKKMGGEVWFKIDRASSEGMEAVNQVHLPLSRVEKNLAICLDLVPTWIQTCLFTWNGAPPNEKDATAFIRLMNKLAHSRHPPRGILLYSLARPSHQPDADLLGKIPLDWAESFRQELLALGLEVRLNP